jgi:XTP/dITP diphosphohydrolase
MEAEKRNELIVATHNLHKLAEISAMLPEWSVRGEDDGAEETAETFEGNALIKARAAAAANKGAWILADDSGLEVDALNMEPGVRSARYAGEPSNSARNNALLLEKLNGVKNRRARFRCAMAIISPEGIETVVEGKCEGSILEAPQGNGGFGYDPLFVPEGYEKSFASLGEEIKNKISHRAKALQAAKEVLDI